MGAATAAGHGQATMPRLTTARSLSGDDLGTETMIVLRAGKKNHHIVRVR